MRILSLRLHSFTKRAWVCPNTLSKLTLGRPSPLPTARLSSKGAMALRDVIAEKLTPDQLNQAQAFAAKYFEQYQPKR